MELVALQINEIDIIEDIEASEDEDYDFENVERVRVRVRKRYIRDGQNPFEFYNNLEFKRRYRFDKDSVLYGILPKIEEGLAKINNRGLPIPPVIQLLICLRYYATASFQLLLGDTITISQSTISRIVFRVSLLIASLLKEYIKMPQTQEIRNENRRLFNNLGKGNGAIGLPGVDGAIDCTHIRLLETRFQNVSEIYRNRKGYFSLNVQTDDEFCDNEEEPVPVDEFNNNALDRFVAREALIARMFH